jgi:hypothetical protein
VHFWKGLAPIPAEVCFVGTVRIHLGSDFARTGQSSVHRVRTSLQAGVSTRAWEVNRLGRRVSHLGTLPTPPKSLLIPLD